MCVGVKDAADGGFLWFFLCFFGGQRVVNTPRDPRGCAVADVPQDTLQFSKIHWRDAIVVSLRPARGPWPVALSQLRFPMRFPMRIYANLPSPCFQMLEWKHSIRKFLPPEAMDNPTPRLSPSADPSALRRCHSLAQKASSLCFWPPPQAQHALEFAEALVLSV